MHNTLLSVLSGNFLQHTTLLISVHTRFYHLPTYLLPFFTLATATTYTNGPHHTAPHSFKDMLSAFRIKKIMGRRLPKRLGGVGQGVTGRGSRLQTERAQGF